MMRLLLFSAFLLTACSREPASPDLAGSYSGQGRDRLCIAGEDEALRAGVIAYGAGDMNCSAAGRLERSDTGFVLLPSGDSECRIPLAVDGGAVTIGDVPATCSYYCAPGATLSGKSFAKDSATTAGTDFAGDPLC